MLLYFQLNDDDDEDMTKLIKHVCLALGYSSKDLFFKSWYVLGKTKYRLHSALVSTIGTTYLNLNSVDDFKLKHINCLMWITLFKTNYLSYINEDYPEKLLAPLPLCACPRSLFITYWNC